jgi:hypothetical protein
VSGLQPESFQGRNDRPLINRGYQAPLFHSNILYTNNKEDTDMGEHCCGLMVGASVPDFKMETYEPSKGDFGEVTLQAIRDQKKWTVLFFYPADFTFV